MERAGQLLSAALLRPIHLLVLGAGLLLSLTVAPWWLFPLSVVAYGAMVTTALRDGAFVRRALRMSDDESAGKPIDWRAVARELGPGPWAAVLQRIAHAEGNLAREVAQAPEAAHGVFTSMLAQLRTAARLGVDLARRWRSLYTALGGYAGMDPQVSRREAASKRARAEAAADEGLRATLLQAAEALDESAKTAESLQAMLGRTSTQLESLAAMLESVTVRSVRLRLSADGGSDDIASTLRAEVEAVRETLGVLEEVNEPSPSGAESETRR
jgi:hypothetical protein